MSASKTEDSIRRFWVTGASSGIGWALAQKLLAQGHFVALSARNAKALYDLATPYGERALVVAADLSQLNQVLAAAEQIRQQWGALDTVVLNAGTCEYIDISSFEAAMIDRVIQANLMTTANCIEAALPLLRLSATPHLVCTSSSVVFLPLPRAGAYGASKAAMTYLLKSLRLDLAIESVAVTIIHPGFVDTPLTQKNDFSMPMRWSSDEAAEYIVTRLSKRPYEINFPWRFIALMKLMSYLPQTVQMQLARRINR